jgi:hypothetical protein
MDLLLEYILSDAHGLMWLRPFVPGSCGRCFPRPGVGNAYPFEGSPRCIPPGIWVPSLGRWGRLDGQSGGEILAARANHWVRKRRHRLHLGLICFRYEVYGSPAVCR